MNIQNRVPFTPSTSPSAPSTSAAPSKVPTTTSAVPPVKQLPSKSGGGRSITELLNGSAMPDFRFQEEPVGNDLLSYEDMEWFSQKQSAFKSGTVTKRAFIPAQKEIAKYKDILQRFINDRNSLSKKETQWALQFEEKALSTKKEPFHATPEEQARYDKINALLTENKVKIVGYGYNGPRTIYRLEPQE